MEEKPKRTRRKAAPAKSADSTVPTKEEALKAVLETVKDDVLPEQRLQQELAEKVYSYMELQSDRTFRRRSFKYKDRTEKDIMHFFNQIIEKWNEAPVDARVKFMLTAFPIMRSFLKKADHELYMLLMYDPEVEGEVVN